MFSFSSLAIVSGLKHLQLSRPGATQRLLPTQRFVLGAVLVYQLALLHRAKNGDDLWIGLKSCLLAA